MRLIDAEELSLNIVEKGQSSKRYKIGELWELNCAEIMDVIDNQPAVDPARRGKWIIEYDPGSGWYRVTCSECGEDVTAEIPMIGFLPNAKPLWDFCPYCGARMEEE